MFIFLREAGIIDLQMEVRFGRFYVDAYSPVLHLAFEADGVAWHAKNVFRDQLKRDCKRDEELLKEFGLTVVRFSEEEINDLPVDEAMIPPPPPPRPPEDIEKAIRLYTETDMSLREVSSEIGVTMPTVRNWLKRNGVKVGEQGRHRKAFQSPLATPRETVDEIVRLYVDEGLSLRRVSELTGVSTATVRNHLTKRGISTRAPGLPTGTSLPSPANTLMKERVDEIIRLYVEEGMTVIEVAVHVGVGRSTVLRWLKQRGVETRKPGRPKKA